MRKQKFNHKEENVFTACGLEEEVVSSKFNEVIDKSNSGKGSTTSQLAESLGEDLSKEELAAMLAIHVVQINAMQHNPLMSMMMGHGDA